MKQMPEVLLTVFLLVLAGCAPMSRAPTDSDGKRYGWSYNNYPDHPDILMRCVGAVRNQGEPFATKIRSDMAYYLYSANFIGSCDAEFGRVHVARLGYIRSGARGTPLPSRGHTFVVFLDKDFRLRHYWRVDSDFRGLYFSESTLRWKDVVLFDFAKLPEKQTVLVDSKIHQIPRWEK